MAFPIVEEGDDIGQKIIDSVLSLSYFIDDGDIFVIAHTIISRAEGLEFFLPDIDPSPFSEIIARKTGKDPNLVHLITEEAERILCIRR